MTRGTVRMIAALLLAATGGGFAPFPALAAQSAPAPAAPASPAPAPLSYADLADFADSAPLVVRAQVRKLTQLEPGQTRSAKPGWARFYVEARTGALLAGDGVLGESLRYLADLPLDWRGRPPKLKKTQVLLFARTVAGRPGELQLTSPDAQIAWDPATEIRLRAILTERLGPGAPVRIIGVREAIHVDGALAGEGETQMFLGTGDGSAASITVNRSQGNAPVWGVSFSEVLEGGTAPQRDTLRWYRLACFLPPALPLEANLSDGAEAKAQAEADYRLVIDGLGPCGRTRG
jgi:hypothetical protein